MRLHDRLDAARQTVDHLAHDTLALDKLPLDQLRSMPDHLRSVPDHLASRLPDELPRRLRRLPRRTSRKVSRAVRGALPRRRRMTTGRWVFVMSVVLVVALYMTVRRFAERVDGALTLRDTRTPDSGPAPAPAGRVPTSRAADAAGDATVAEPVEAPLLDA